MAQIRQISNVKNSKLPESYNNFQKVGSQDYRRILVFFFTFIYIM
jgi:predicted nucleic acid binding AN1-type Zn finger protein